MPIRVQKKDGRLEDFDRNKVLNGVVKSGASVGEAETITQQIEAWVQTAAVNGMVSSMNLRQKVLEVLKATNPVAGEAFENYRKPPLEPPAGEPPPPVGGPAGEPPVNPSGAGPVQPPPAANPGETPGGF
jgi:hypothetical protein